MVNGPTLSKAGVSMALREVASSGSAKLALDSSESTRVVVIGQSGRPKHRCKSIFISKLMFGSKRAFSHRISSARCSSECTVEVENDEFERPYGSSASTEHHWCSVSGQRAVAGARRRSAGARSASRAVVVAGSVGQHGSAHRALSRFLTQPSLGSRHLSTRDRRSGAVAAGKPQPPRAPTRRGRTAAKLGCQYPGPRRLSGCTQPSELRHSLDYRSWERISGSTGRRDERRSGYASPGPVAGQAAFEPAGDNHGPDARRPDGD